MGFSRQEYWNGLPFPSPGDLPNPGIEPGSPELQADTLPSESSGRFQFDYTLFTKTIEISLNIHKGFLSTLEIPNIWLMEATSDFLFFDVSFLANSTFLESLLVDWIYFEHFSLMDCKVMSLK